MSQGSEQIERILLVLIGVLLAGAAVVYWISESELNGKYEVAAEPISLPVGDAAVAEGERLANVRGCFWCHGPQLQGQKYFAEANRGVIVTAPDLTQRLREYSPAEFARAVRHGVRPDGTSLQPAMPSFAFFNMSDADLGAIMAYIHSLPEQNGLQGGFRLLPWGRVRWVRGELPPNVADLIDHDATRPTPHGSAEERGRYLAESTCTECHGDNGRIRVPGTPDLIVASAYDEEAFFRLMRSGVTRDERAIDYHMVDAAKYRYTFLHDTEVSDLYAYFQSLVR